MDKVRIAAVGLVSDHFWRVAGNFAALPAVEFVAVADPHPELCQRAQQRFGFKRNYGDYRLMLDKEQVDAVMVYTDNASKADVVEEAARRGLHVCQDKPMSATLAQADRIVRAVEQSGIKLLVTYYSHFGAAYGKAKELIEQGKIGKVYLARAIIGHAGCEEVGLSRYFIDCLYSPERNGGGVFNDEACYAALCFTDYLGPVEEVCAFMVQSGLRRLPPGVEDNTVAMVRFKSGALGIMDVKWGQYGNMPFGNSFHGSEGTILSGAEGVRIYSRTALPGDLVGWVDLGIGRTPRPGFGTEAEYFVRCILEDRPIASPVNAQGARAAQEVLEACYLSARTGKVVKLPLQ